MLCLEPTTDGLEFIGMGIECAVYGWGDEVVKTFATQKEAMFARSMQEEAHACDCAPAVGDDVFRIWCAKGTGPAYRGWDNKWRWAYVSEWADCQDEPSQEEWNDLESRLSECGICGYDMHRGNVGFVDGVLMRIDFGEYSST